MLTLILYGIAICFIVGGVLSAPPANKWLLMIAVVLGVVGLLAAATGGGARLTIGALAKPPTLHRDPSLSAHTLKLALARRPVAPRLANHFLRSSSKLPNTTS